MQCVDYDVLFANKNVTATGAAVAGKRSFNVSSLCKRSNVSSSFIIRSSTHMATKDMGLMS